MMHFLIKLNTNQFLWFYGLDPMQMLQLIRTWNFICSYLINQLSRDMTKPTKWGYAQWRLRSARASAQSDQSSVCAQWVAKDPRFLHADSEDSDQILIRLGGCPGWSESLLGTQSLCWFCHVVAKLFVMMQEPAENMSRTMTKPTKWSVCPAKTQISLGIHLI